MASLTLPLGFESRPSDLADLGRLVSPRRRSHPWALISTDGFHCRQPMPGAQKRYQLRLINSGSYRMGKSKSGDIDLLCVISSRREVPPLLKRMEESEPLLWKYIYNKSTKKVNGIIQNPLTKKIHQMDMIFVYEKEVPWMLLYFGSGKEFSKKIRAHAIQKGYKLNEKGLYYHKTNRRVSFYPKDEREIFDFLEYPYVKPEDRG